MYDVIVVGTGLVGSTLLCALRDTKLKIAVLDKAPATPASVTPSDQRPLSLARASQVYLAQLGVWSALSDMAGPIDQVHISEAGHFGQCTFTAADFSGEKPGVVVPAGALQSALFARALDNPACHTFQSQAITGITQQDDSITLCYRDSESTHSLQGKLLIAADGLQSPCRHILGIATSKQDHRDVALTAILSLAVPHEAVAYERFTKQGVMAILPMWDVKQLRLVWTLDAEKASALDAAAVLAAVTAAFGGRLSALTDCQLTGTYPLSTVIAKTQTQGRAVLLGDSAHRLYPLAAQGYNLSLRDVRVLSRLLHKALRHGDDIGGEALLQRYVSQRASAQSAVLRVTQSLECVFGLQLPFLGLCRGVGLLATDAIAPLKQSIIQAIGG